MTRKGKIARLPCPIREQINRRIQDGENGRHTIDWLNSLDEVKAALSQNFDNTEITNGNLSEWKLGGYRDWEMSQATLDETHRIVSEGLELGKAGENALADKLGVWLLGRYVVVTRRLIENENDPAAWKLLRELCHDVVALRRGEHGAEWLRIEQERLKLHQQKQESNREKLKEEIRQENPPREVLSDEEKERQMCAILGCNPEFHPAYQKRNPFASDPAPAESRPETVPASTDLEPPIQEGIRLGSEESTGTQTVAEGDGEAAEFQRIKVLAEKGDAYSAYCLGASYRDGLGVAKDFAKAREWLAKAASLGLGGAKLELHSLLMHSSMSSDKGPTAKMECETPEKKS